MSDKDSILVTLCVLSLLGIAFVAFVASLDMGPPEGGCYFVIENGRVVSNVCP